MSSRQSQIILLKYSCFHPLIVVTFEQAGNSLYRPKQLPGLVVTTADTQGLLSLTLANLERPITHDTHLSV